MKWYKKLSLLFARKSVTAGDQDPEPAIESAIESAIEPVAIDIPESKTTAPLMDVWSVATQNGWITVDQDTVEHYLQALGNISPLDMGWRGSASNPHPYVATLENVTLIPGSKILIDGKGNALSDEMEAGFRTFELRPKRWDMELSDGPCLSFTPLPLADEIIPVGVHLMGEHEANYFHWMTEVLPRIYLYLKLTREEDTQLLVSDGLNDNLYELLRIICGTERVIKRLKSGSSYRVSRLVYPSDVSRIFDVYDRAPSLETTYLPVNLLGDMIRTMKMAIGPDAGTGGKRVYVKRVSTYRALLNDAEIENFLVDNGFISVDPGQLSIREQVELFAQADIVIGPSGAAMTNMVWCREQTRVLVLHSDHPFKKYPYWDALARVAGAQISYLSGPRANNVQGLFEAHDDYRIQIDSIKHALKELGCT